MEATGYSETIFDGTAALPEIIYSFTYDIWT
jgi:hypothetical protein